MLLYSLVEQEEISVLFDRLVTCGLLCTSTGTRQEGMVVCRKSHKIMFIR